MPAWLEMVAGPSPWLFRGLGARSLGHSPGHRWTSLGTPSSSWRQFELDGAVDEVCAGRVHALAD